jgi:hypothetical protein
MQRNRMNILSKVTIWGNKRPESVLCVHVFGIEPCIINTFQRRMKVWTGRLRNDILFVYA